ncbi:smoothelin-like protein 1 [Littorina saxatilis]|uniref:Uncharacterized protein n=1 Tax=Littorina saxatilis TaxID=31220 RepID=A0AAN9GF45_9CAEN
MADSWKWLSFFIFLSALLSAYYVKGDNSPTINAAQKTALQNKGDQKHPSPQPHSVGAPNQNGLINHNGAAQNQNGNLNHNVEPKQGTQNEANHEDHKASGKEKQPEHGNPNKKPNQNKDGKKNEANNHNEATKQAEAHNQNEANKQNEATKQNEAHKQAEANSKPQTGPKAKETDMGIQPVPDNKPQDNKPKTADHFVAISDEEIKKLLGTAQKKNDKGFDGEKKPQGKETPLNDDDENGAALKPLASDAGLGSPGNETFAHLGVSDVMEDVKYVMLSACVAVVGVALLVIVATATMTKKRRRPYERCRGFGDECEMRSNFQLVNHDERLGRRDSANYLL